MIIAPVDYFWHFLKDGPLASKAAIFLTFYFLFFYLVFFMQDESWRCMWISDLFLRFLTN